MWVQYDRLKAYSDANEKAPSHVDIYGQRRRGRKAPSDVHGGKSLDFRLNQGHVSLGLSSTFQRSKKDTSGVPQEPGEPVPLLLHTVEDDGASVDCTRVAHGDIHGGGEKQFGVAACLHAATPPDESQRRPKRPPPRNASPDQLVAAAGLSSKSRTANTTHVDFSRKAHGSIHGGRQKQFRMAGSDPLHRSETSDRFRTPTSYAAHEDFHHRNDAQIHGGDTDANRPVLGSPRMQGPPAGASPRSAAGSTGAGGDPYYRHVETFNPQPSDARAVARHRHATMEQAARDGAGLHGSAGAGSRGHHRGAGLAGEEAPPDVGDPRPPRPPRDGGAGAGAGGGGPSASPRARRPSLHASSMLQVAIPPGVGAGGTFELAVGGQRILVTVPDGMAEGQTLHLAVPSPVVASPRRTAAEPEPTAAASASPAHSQGWQSQSGSLPPLQQSPLSPLSSPGGVHNVLQKHDEMRAAGLTSGQVSARQQLGHGPPPDRLSPRTGGSSARFGYQQHNARRAPPGAYPSRPDGIQRHTPWGHAPYSDDRRGGGGGGGGGRRFKAKKKKKKAAHAFPTGRWIPGVPTAGLNDIGMPIQYRGSPVVWDTKRRREANARAHLITRAHSKASRRRRYQKPFHYS